ncbi:hypothetical protein L6R52_31270 [Myxococcota bacterium]|nr:hypothetical protein [Myxococcota bacterium]
MNTTTRSSLIPPLVLASLAAGLSACAAKPTAEEYDDIASSTAALVSDEPSGEGEAVADAIVSARGGLPAAMTREGAGSLRGRRGSIDYAFELTCRDAAGVELATCEGADEAHLVLAWDGELTTARRSITVSRDGDWTLTDLTTAEAQLDGTGSFHGEGEFAALSRALMRSWIFDYQAEYQAVKIDTQTHRINSGTASYQIEAQKTVSRANRTVERTLSVSAEVTFLGNGQAQLVLDGDRSYTITLADGSVISR